MSPGSAWQRQALPPSGKSGPRPRRAETPPRGIPLAEPPTQPLTEEVLLSIDDRRYRIRGLAKNLSFDVLKINLLAARGDAFHVDTLDLYSARQRAAFLIPGRNTGRIEVVSDHTRRRLVR